MVTTGSRHLRGSRWRCVRADDVAAVVDTCIAAFGRIDMLHNNVGIVEVGGPVETSEESWDRVNDVNLKSIFLTRTRSCRG